MKCKKEMSFNLLNYIKLPIILLDINNQISDMTQSALELLNKLELINEKNNSFNENNNWLLEHIKAFSLNSELEEYYKKDLEINKRIFHLSINMMKIFENNSFQGISISINDNSDHEEFIKIVKKQFEFEKVVSQISTKLAGISDLNSEMDFALKKIGKISGASRAYIFILDENKNTLSNTHEWCAEGVPSEIDNLQNIPINSLKWWMDNVYNNQIINITNLANLPETAETEKRMLESQNIKSLLVVPLYDYNSKNSYGFIGLDNVNSSEIWNKKNILLLTIVAEVIVKVLNQKNIAAKLKQNEENIKQKNLVLKNTISKLKKTQSHLIQQEKLAGIGQLAAGVAHEINNPLGFLISNMDTLSDYVLIYKEIIEKYQLLKKQVINSDPEEFNTTIKEINELEEKYDLDFINEDLNSLLNDSKEGLDRVSKIVKGLRLFSRVDQLYEYEEYDLTKGIENVLVIAKNEIKYNSKIKLNLGDIPPVHVIGSQLNQVLLNIIINASHAIKDKNSKDMGLITITTYHDAAWVYCEVTDTGSGISKENINKIFEPFFTTKPIGKGTGLGLSIAYDIIVNKHKGDLLVKSSPNQGTKFTIKLPIKPTK